MPRLSTGENFLWYNERNIQHTSLLLWVWANSLYHQGGILYVFSFSVKVLPREETQ